MVALGLHVQAIPAGLAGREPLSRRMSVKHFGPSSLLLLFMLPIISLECKALEVVVLCSEALCFVLAQHLRALIPARIQTTTAHVNQAGNNT